MADANDRMLTPDEQEYLRRKDAASGTAQKPDPANPLRADIMGSMVKSDPASPGYLGRIDNLITAHGALETMSPNRPPAEMSPRVPSSRMTTPPTAPDMGRMPGPSMPGAPVTGLPTTMGSPAKPQRSWLRKIGQVASKMGNIAGDVIAPGLTAMIPGTDLNKKWEASRAEKVSERQRQLDIEQEKADAEKLTATQRPELAEEKGRIQGMNEAQRAEETQKLWQERDAARDAHDDKKMQEAEQRLQAMFQHSDTQQAARFAEQDKLVDKRIAAGQPGKLDARADKSFQYNNTALDKVAAPLDQINQRMGRLQDTLSQNTPQADALVAPELLSVMSGGAGSGLRMNEAEISRIVGGRSNWESLKAAVNKWSLDPKEALSITPEQRKEIRALAKTVQDKLIQKEKIIDESRNALIDTDDPKEHRRIVADTKKKLDQIDSGEGGSDATQKKGSFKEF